MSEQSSLWNKDFLLDTGINFVVYLIYYLLMVIIAVVAKDELHASLGEAGLASGIFIVGTHGCSWEKPLNYTDANVLYIAAL